MRLTAADTSSFKFDAVTADLTPEWEIQTLFTFSLMSKIKDTDRRRYWLANEVRKFFALPRDPTDFWEVCLEEPLGIQKNGKTTRILNMLLGAVDMGIRDAGTIDHITLMNNSTWKKGALGIPQPDKKGGEVHREAIKRGFNDGGRWDLSDAFFILLQRIEELKCEASP